jgi:amidase
MSYWKAKIAAKQAERDKAIPEKWKLKPEVLARWANKDGVVDFFDKEPGILNDEERAMTECTATQAIAKLQSGEWSSLAVTSAVCHRAAIAQQLLNCLTEIFFEDALKRAAELDAEFKRTGKPTGPLHGLPISIKDLFFYPGYDSTKGLVAYIGDPVPKDAAWPVPMKVFWEAGCVYYCKTQVPQSMVGTPSLLSEVR